MSAAREYSFTRSDFDFLRRLSNQRSGIVVTDDKFDMFYSRLARRVRMLGLSSFADYCDYLEVPDNANEISELVNAVTTNLTAFFRENHHFDFLANTSVAGISAAKSRFSPAAHLVGRLFNGGRAVLDCDGDRRTGGGVARLGRTGAGQRYRFERAGPGRLRRLIPIARVEGLPKRGLQTLSSRKGVALSKARRACATVCAEIYVSPR